MTWGLPKSLEVGGREYGIHSDFREVLDVMEILEDPKEKIRAMEIIMRHFSDQEFEWNERLLSIVNIFRIKVTEFSGRARR